MVLSWSIGRASALRLGALCLRGEETRCHVRLAFPFLDGNPFALGTQPTLCYL